MKTITITVIPHEEQRYETCGDWKINRNGNIDILVSDTGNIWYNALIGVHELWEVLLCKKRGISDEKVTEFDKEFESNRPDRNEDEPGDDLHAPYRDEHCSATGAERILASQLGIPWTLYEEAVNRL